MPHKVCELPPSPPSPTRGMHGFPPFFHPTAGARAPRLATLRPHLAYLKSLHIIKRVPKGSSTPFRTAVPFWGRTTWTLSGLPPKGDCGTRRVDSGGGLRTTTGEACHGGKKYDRRHGENQKLKHPFVSCALVTQTAENDDASTSMLCVTRLNAHDPGSPQ